MLGDDDERGAYKARRDFNCDNFAVSEDYERQQGRCDSFNPMLPFTDSDERYRRRYEVVIPIFPLH